MAKEKMKKKKGEKITPAILWKQRWLLLDTAFRRQLVHQGIRDRRTGEHHRRSCHGQVLFRLGILSCPLQDVIGKAQFHSAVGVHPSFRIHQMGKFGTGQSRLDLIGVDDALLYFREHTDRLFHLSGIAKGNRGRIVDHHHGNRGDQYPCPGHSNHTGGRSRNAVNLYGHVSGIVHEHVVDLGSCHTVSARRIDPYGDIPAAGTQFFLKDLRRDIIVKPAFLCDGAVEEQRPLLYRLLCLLIQNRLVLPLPELLHRILPPSHCRHRQRIFPHPPALSCSH